MIDCDCDCELMKRATCSLCGVDILWARTLASASMPLDAEHSDAGKWRIEGVTCLHVEGGGHVAHWATCLRAAERRPRKPAPAPRQEAEHPSSTPGTLGESSDSSEAPGAPSAEVRREEPLQRRIARLLLRDRALSVPRAERLRLAEIVDGLRTGMVDADLVELGGSPADIETLRGDRAWRALRDAAACCVAGTWEQHQALELVLAEPTRKEEVA